MSLHPSVFSHRLIQLTFPGPHVHDSQPAAVISSFKVFQLPAFPLSQSDWLAGLGANFYRQHKRGLVVLLVLDVVSQQWIRPIVPTQTCTPVGASFRFEKADLAALSPQARIAGSFQLSDATLVEEAETQVPPFDGLHVVRGSRGRTKNQFSFLRVSGAVGAVQPELLIFDDWRHYLHLYRERLVLT